MDAARFETLLRALATAPSRRGILRLLAGSALAGFLPLGTQPGRAKRRGKGKGKRKITVCHAGQTRRVRKQAKKRHLRHGDTRGACPPPECPPVCPLCQGCDAATGVCFAPPSQQSLPAPGCAAPKLCCSGTCCDPPNHFCNSAGGCATCAEVCPANCGHCFSLAEGGTACADGGSCNPSDPVCTSTADCPDGKQCATSYTTRSGNTPKHLCKPVGTGACVSITPCS